MRSRVGVVAALTLALGGCRTWPLAIVPPAAEVRVASSLGTVDVVDVKVDPELYYLVFEQKDERLQREMEKLGFESYADHVEKRVEERCRAAGAKMGESVAVSIDVRRFYFDSDAWWSWLTFPVLMLFGVPFRVDEAEVDVTFHAVRGEFSRDYVYDVEEWGPVGLYYNNSWFLPGRLLGELADRFVVELQRDLAVAAKAPAPTAQVAGQD